VSKGRHAKRTFVRDRLPVLVLLVAVTSIAVGGTAYAAIRYDRETHRKIMPGVQVAGVDVSGMTRPEALRAVRDEARGTLSRRLSIEAGSRTWEVTPSDLGTDADVASAVGRAVAVTDSMGFFSRVYHRLADRSVGRDFRLGFDHDQSAVGSFVDGLVESVSEPATDAGLALEDGNVVMQHAKTGRTLATDVAVGRIRKALRGSDADVRLPLEAVKPEVTEDDLGYTIVISRPKNQLYLYKGFEIAKTYGVATAAAGYETPGGTWSVINKVENPTWVNPAPNGWGASLPAQIAPGPGNPLGTRALYLNAPGIRIHGTYATDSIGTYASHGCVRMTISDAEELFELVPVGTKVLVI
jgi:lipoprotein-anchoring transpeptidase ErfK/SrfK